MYSINGKAHANLEYPLLVVCVFVVYPLLWVSLPIIELGFLEGHKLFDESFHSIRDETLG